MKVLLFVLLFFGLSNSFASTSFVGGLTFIARDSVMMHSIVFNGPAASALYTRLQVEEFDSWTRENHKVKEALGVSCFKEIYTKEVECEMLVESDGRTISPKESRRDWTS